MVASSVQLYATHHPNSKRMYRKKSEGWEYFASRRGSYLQGRVNATELLSQLQTRWIRCEVLHFFFLFEKNSVETPGWIDNPSRVNVRKMESWRETFQGVLMSREWCHHTDLFCTFHWIWLDLKWTRVNYNPQFARQVEHEIHFHFPPLALICGFAARWCLRTLVQLDLTGDKMKPRRGGREGEGALVCSATMTHKVGPWRHVIQEWRDK